jgi:phage gp29-like protein
MIEYRRARGHKTHITFQDALQLGQFVQAGFAQERANQDQPLARIVMKICGRCGGIDPHALELGHFEYAALAADPLAKVKCGA